MSVDEVPRRRGGESATKLLRLLLEFSEQAPLHSVADLAARTALPQSTVYRYVGLLKDVGLVDEAERGVYRLTERVFALASAARKSQGSLVDIARPLLEQLRDGTGETVFLVRRSGFRAFCLDRVESHRAVRLSTAPGTDMVLSSGSAGKVLLAALNRNELANFREHVAGTRSSGERSVPSDADLAVITAQGYAESRDEIDEGVWGISAPITMDDRVVAALGVAGPLFRIEVAEQERIRNEVVVAANRLSRALDPSKHD